MKTINYRGMTFEVEDHFKYIATDADGSIWIFENEPVYCDEDRWLVESGECRELKMNFKPEHSLENI